MKMRLQVFFIIIITGYVSCFNAKSQITGPNAVYENSNNNYYNITPDQPGEYEYYWLLENPNRGIIIGQTGSHCLVQWTDTGANAIELWVVQFHQGEYVSEELAYSYCVSVQNNSPCEFYYDAAGNRLRRELIMYYNCLKSAKTNPNNNFAPDNNDLMPEEFLLSEGIKVYPNPVEDQLNINLGTNSQKSSYKVELFNELGKSFLKKLIVNQFFSLDMGNLPPGAYILIITAANERKEYKLIKK